MSRDDDDNGSCNGNNDDDDDVDDDDDDNDDDDDDEMERVPDDGFGGEGGGGDISASGFAGSFMRSQLVDTGQAGSHIDYGGSSAGMARNRFESSGSLVTITAASARMGPGFAGLVGSARLSGPAGPPRHMKVFLQSNSHFLRFRGQELS
ncbi:hypothetical protein FNF28_07684 [Cafeteria roenbergensis]|uniref:Uncharacterized protein n=1 Tax=Cafeteria roenbergensis TaxID=33653 RepID=A0A5A8C072_CAFRO|nr:hypothetical protein FNF28_07684 [Cafeteria roenbergensis]